MDTIRLKFRRSLPASNKYFSENVNKKELHSEHVSGNRYTWTNNTWRKDMQRKGLYVPKYWIEEDFVNKAITDLCIEVSLPKLLFGENLKELKNEDFEKIVEKIVDFSRYIGVPLFSQEVRVAKPTLLAIGKNIPMTGICSCDLALKVLIPFDYKPHADPRIIAFNDHKGKGRELYFSIKNTETTKFYDKKKEIINQSKTTEGRILADKFSCPDCVIEIFRVERTFKTKRKIGERFRPYLNGKDPSFENLFNKEIWDCLLKDEIDNILNHPLTNFMFLALEKKPFIDAFLNKHYGHIQTRNNIKGLIEDLQEFGLMETRRKYLNSAFRSRQSWYNYQGRLVDLSKQINWQELSNLDSFKIHGYILKQFGIDNSYQSDLGLNFTTGLSKKIDTQPRNTGGGRHD